MQAREAESESEAEETPGDACYSHEADCEADCGGAKRQCKSAVGAYT